jgi:hypothetical protein
MATTFRQLLNDVLRVLGEEEIASSTGELNDDYRKLVASFVNIIKEEVEDAHNWRALRQEHSATIGANELSGTVTGANERSRLLRIADNRYGRLVPLVYDVTDADDPAPLVEMDLPALIHYDKVDPTQRADEEPTYFALDNSAGDGIAIYVWPRPETQRTLSVVMVTPQPRLDDDDLDEVIKVPTRPIFQGAVWYALEERGEELGINAMFSEQRYAKALDDAIARDSAEAGDAYELVVT